MKGLRRREIRPIMSGELRHIGDLERVVVGHDSTGAPTKTYALFAAGVRFAIDDWKGIENFITNQVASSLTTRIRIRYRPGVVETMRLSHVTNPGDPVPAVDHYEITGIIRDITLRQELQLVCLRHGLGTS